MDPTWELVEKCYDASRKFLKKGAKADNKSYDGNINWPKRVDADQRIEAGKALASIRESNVSYVTLGQLMRETGNTRGDCGEMTGLAASYVAEYMPDVNMAVGWAWPIEGHRAMERSHVFLVVGALGNTPATVNELTNASEQERSYVIDVWAGVCCHASDYPEKLQEKMSKWTHDGKIVGRVVDPENPEWITPSQWAKEVCESSFRTSDPRVVYRPNPDNKQTVLEKLEQAHSFSAFTLEYQLSQFDTREQIARSIQEKIQNNPAEYRQERAEQIRNELQFLEGGSFVSSYMSESERQVWEQSNTQKRDELTQAQSLLTTNPEEFLKKEFASASSELESVERASSIANKKQEFVSMQTDRRHGPSQAPPSGSEYSVPTENNNRGKGHGR